MAVEETVELVKLDSQERVQQQTAETVAVVRLSPRERVQQRTAETVAVVGLAPRERVQKWTAEVLVESVSLVSGTSATADRRELGLTGTSATADRRGAVDGEFPPGAHLGAYTDR